MIMVVTEKELLNEVLEQLRNVGLNNVACIENDSAVLDEDLYHQSNISIKKFVSDFGGSALSSTPFMFNAQSLSLETNKDRILFNEDIRTKDRSI